MKWLATALGTWGCLCLCLLCCSAPVVLARDTAGDDRLLKSAFIYNFAKFTRWPQDSKGGRSAPLKLCTVGTDTLVGSLDRLAVETIRGRRVTIGTFNINDAGNACHILYIAESEHDRFPRLIERTRAFPVLTISQIRGFAAAGGIIQLYQTKGRIRFKINLRGAQTRKLSLSARLLDLADLIDDGVTP